MVLSYKFLRRILSIQGIIALLVFTHLVACESDLRSRQVSKKTKQDSLIERVPAAKLFYERQLEFDEIVAELYKDSLISKKRALMFFAPNNFPSRLRNKMEKLGITRLIYYTAYCDSLARKGSLAFEFDFTTNWKSPIPIHITREICPTDENQVGAYVKRNNGNEIWGLGDNWVIWYEHYLTYDKSSPPTYSPN